MGNFFSLRYWGRSFINRENSTGLRPSISHSISQSSVSPLSHSVCRSVSQSVGWSVSESVSQLVSQSVVQSVSHWVSQSVGQSVSQFLRTPDLICQPYIPVHAGGTGALSYTLSHYFPNMKITICECSSVVASAHHFQPSLEDCPNQGNVTFVVGDFFQPDLPKADLYVIMRVFHDWSDEEVKLILHNVSSCMSTGNLTTEASLFFSIKPPHVKCRTRVSELLVWSITLMLLVNVNIYVVV